MKKFEILTQYVEHEPYVFRYNIYYEINPITFFLNIPTLTNKLGEIIITPSFYRTTYQISQYFSLRFINNNKSSLYIPNISVSCLNFIYDLNTKDIIKCGNFGELVFRIDTSPFRYTSLNYDFTEEKEIYSLPMCVLQSKENTIEKITQNLIKVIIKKIKLVFVTLRSPDDRNNYRNGELTAKENELKRANILLMNFLKKNLDLFIYDLNNLIYDELIMEYSYF